METLGPGEMETPAPARPTAGLGRPLAAEPTPAGSEDAQVSEQGRGSVNIQMRKCLEKNEKKTAVRFLFVAVLGQLLASWGFPPNLCARSTVTPVTDTCRQLLRTGSQAGARGEPGPPPALEGPARRPEDWLLPRVTTAADTRSSCGTRTENPAGARARFHPEAGGPGRGRQLHPHPLIQHEGQEIIFGVIAKGERDKMLHIHC